MSKTRKPTTYAILYLRPDGWWVSGEGWEDSADAVAAAEAHDWGGTEWKVEAVGSEAYKEAKALEAKAS